MSPNRRCMVTSFTRQELQYVGTYVTYRGRGQSENYIKDLKMALQADRLHCPRFFAYFFRLLLHAAAHRLTYALSTISPLSASTWTTANSTRFGWARTRSARWCANPCVVSSRALRHAARSPKPPVRSPRVSGRTWTRRSRWSSLAGGASHQAAGPTCSPMAISVNPVSQMVVDTRAPFLCCVLTATDRAFRRLGPRTHLS